jgi:putative transposase
LPCFANRTLDLPLPLSSAGRAQLTERIKEIAATRVRYGYRRIHVLLRREGWRVNVKRVYRLYREMGLQLRHKTPKRRVKAKLREDRRHTTRPNETWAMDFVHDQLATGTKLRVLTIVDTFSASHQRSNRGSSSAALTWWRCRKESGDRSGSRPPSASTKALSLYRAIWICGRTSAVSRSTSLVLANRPTTPSSRVVQRQIPRRMPERTLVHEPRRRATKMRGLT